MRIHMTGTIFGTSKVWSQESPVDRTEHCSTTVLNETLKWRSCICSMGRPGHCQNFEYGGFHYHATSFSFYQTVDAPNHDTVNTMIFGSIVHISHASWINIHVTVTEFPVFTSELESQYFSEIIPKGVLSRSVFSPKLYCKKRSFLLFQLHNESNTRQVHRAFWKEHSASHSFWHPLGLHFVVFQVIVSFNASSSHNSFEKLWVWKYKYSEFYYVNEQFLFALSAQQPSKLMSFLPSVHRIQMHKTNNLTSELVLKIIWLHDLFVKYRPYEDFKPDSCSRAAAFGTSVQCFNFTSILFRKQALEPHTKNMFILFKTFHTEERNASHCDPNNTLRISWNTSFHLCRSVNGALPTVRSSLELEDLLGFVRLSPLGNLTEALFLGLNFKVSVSPNVSTGQFIGGPCSKLAWLNTATYNSATMTYHRK